MPDFARPMAVATPALNPGLTSSAQLNVGLGGGLTGGVNAAVASQAGGDTVLLGAGLAMFFNWFKQWSRFDQQRHAHIALLLFGLLVGIVVFGIVSHIEWGQAIAKGCGIAVNAWADYVGVSKVAGVPGLPAANPISGVGGYAGARG